MSTTDTQSKIQAATVRFTDELVALFGEAFAAIASDLTVKAPAKAKPAAKKAVKVAKPAKPVKVAKPAKPVKVAKPAKPAKPAKVAKPAKPAKVAKPAKPAKPVKVAKPAKPAKPGGRIRRSENQLAADGANVVKLLAANKKGLRIEQINKQLGTSTKQLARPIIKLLAEGKIRKVGNRRATTYLPA